MYVSRVCWNYTGVKRQRNDPSTIMPEVDIIIGVVVIIEWVYYGCVS